MVKWPFRRKQTEDSVPQEVQEYYQSEKRERVGIAWMLALATLVVTVLLALGILYGGRWAYRAIFDDNEGNAPVEQGQQEQADGNGGADTNGGSETDVPATLPGDGTDGNSETEREEADSPYTTPQTGPALPETGPSDNI